jgi:hypothetical protein
MNAIAYLFTCIGHFLCIGLDVTIFFLQIRLVLLWKDINWLVPFDDAGKSIVNAVSLRVSARLNTKQPLSEKGKLIVALMALVLLRIILGMVLRH